VREVADTRVHGTTGEAPIERFRRDEAQALQPLAERPPFRQWREVARRVQADSCIDLDTNRYSVPWRFIGALVTVQIAPDELRILHGGVEVARHTERRGRRERVIDAAHLVGIVANDPRVALAPVTASRPDFGELLRPLADYERAVGGGW
jgi:hypothetical protein